MYSSVRCPAARRDRTDRTHTHTPRDPARATAQKLTPIAQHDNTLIKLQQQVCNMSNMMHIFAQHIQTAERVGNILSVTTTPQNAIADTRTDNYITTTMVQHFLHKHCSSKRGRAAANTKRARPARMHEATSPWPKHSPAASARARMLVLCSCISP